MASNHYESNGVLVLKTVTPVIEALFGPFDLKRDEPGEGRVYIRKGSEEFDPQWDDILAGLQRLAADRAIAPLGDDAKAHILALRPHFERSVTPEIVKLIMGIDFDNSADLSDLFYLALLFDDGHGLTAMDIEGCWFSGKPRLFEFGGSGLYRGRHASVYGSSKEARDLGAKVDLALASNDQELAAKHLTDHFNMLLDGVVDEAVRMALTRNVAAALAAATGCTQS